VPPVATRKRVRGGSRPPYAPGMNLREELPGDEQTVRDIHRRAFGDHGIAVADLVDTLRGTITTDSGLSLVAEHAGQIVGHIMFTRCLLDAPRRLVDVQVLSPLAVAPEYQKQGIGSALIREGLEIMARQQVPLVFLEGDPGYYSRFGFLPGGEQGFRKPSLRIPDAAFQFIGLPRHEPWMTGTLVYSDPFWRHDAVGLRDPNA
jgi:putative acetyltransferase